MPGHRRRVGLALALVLVAAACGGAAPTMGADAVVTGSVMPGGLRFGLPQGRPTFGPLRLVGDREREAASTLPFTVDDARGSGAGWAITVTSAAVRSAGRPVPGAVLTVAGAGAACAGCTLPRNRVAYPVGLTGRDGPVKIFAARRRTGMGSLRLSIGLVVAVPARSKVRGGTIRLVFSHTAGP